MKTALTRTGFPAEPILRVREDPASKRASLGGARWGRPHASLDGPEPSLNHRKWLRLNGGAQKPIAARVTIVACFFWWMI
jgi:hypothetical protein